MTIRRRESVAEAEARLERLQAGLERIAKRRIKERQRADFNRLVRQELIRLMAPSSASGSASCSCSGSCSGSASAE
jgi:hypothetical protein